MVEIYCDESGFSGNNLLDKDQQFFVFASVAITPERADELVKMVRRDFKIQAKELKGRQLLRTSKGRRAVSFLIQNCSPYTKIVIHHKKYALAAKFFEIHLRACTVGL